MDPYVAPLIRAATRPIEVGNAYDDQADSLEDPGQSGMKSRLGVLRRVIAVTANHEGCDPSPLGRFLRFPVSSVTTARYSPRRKSRVGSWHDAYGNWVNLPSDAIEDVLNVNEPVAGWTSVIVEAGKRALTKLRMVCQMFVAVTAARRSAVCWRQPVLSCQLSGGEQ